MAAKNVTTASSRAFKSVTGTAAAPDSVAIRLAPSETGEVYIEKSEDGSVAASTTSFFITGAEVYSTTMIAGQELTVCTSTGDTDIRIEAPESGLFS